MLTRAGVGNRSGRASSPLAEAFVAANEDCECLCVGIEKEGQPEASAARVSETAGR